MAEPEMMGTPTTSGASPAGLRLAALTAIMVGSMMGRGVVALPSRALHDTAGHADCAFRQHHRHHARSVRSTPSSRSPWWDSKLPVFTKAEPIIFAVVAASAVLADLLIANEELAIG